MHIMLYMLICWQIYVNLLTNAKSTNCSNRSNSMRDIVMLLTSVIIVISLTVMTDFIAVLKLLAGLDAIANLDKSASHI